MSPERIGRYEIREVLGRGAMGVVYLARDPVIDRLVALKALRLDLSPVDAVEFRARFLREARAAGRLHHPGLVTIFDAGEDREQGLLFIAMEYVEGETLKAVVRSGRRLATRRVAELGRQMAEALDVAHAGGVVHRDVKPANVILTPGGAAKITDFGVARHGPSEHTQEGTILGSPPYMSPEQASGATADGRSDLYSVGVVLFELLTGRLPFVAGSLPELSTKIVREPAPDLGRIRPELASTFAPIVQRCLAKSPADRYASGADLARALAAIAGELPTENAGDEPARAVAGPAALPPAVDAGEDALSATQKSRDIAAQAIAKAGEPPPSSPTRRPWPALALAAVVVVALAAVAFLLRPSGTSVLRLLPAAVAPDPGPALLETASARLRSGDLRGAIDAAGQVREGSASFGEAQVVLAEARRRLDAESRPSSIAVSFLSPSSRGAATFTLDGKPLDRVSWDFTHKGILGITLSGSGQVYAKLATPPGSHALGVRLESEKDGLLGGVTFSQEFPPGSRWALKVEPAKQKGKLRFSLRRAEGANPPEAPTPRS